MREFRWITGPVAKMYGGVLYLRNVLYNMGLFKSYDPQVKTIALGNLSLGGTGKTPHVEYLLNLLAAHNVAVLSRGYGRNTRGTYSVDPGKSTAGEAGDEPLQIARKFPQVPVVCDGDRVRGIRFIEERFPETSVIILDDALQHRRVRAGLNLLLTPYDRPFPSDHILPRGELRDHPIRARQADAFIVTKTPPDADEKTKTAKISLLAMYGKPIFFSGIRYGEVVGLHGDGRNTLSPGNRVAVLTGIARPENFLHAVEENHEVVRHFSFPDHHAYSAQDIKAIRDFIGNFDGPIDGVVTTEKDAMRLVGRTDISKEWTFPVFYWKIRMDFGPYKSEFDELIHNYVDQS